MSDWPIRKLREVCEIIMGQSPPSSTYNEKEDGLPFFQGKSEFGSRFPTERKWCTKPLKKAKKDDILMSVRAPVGPVNIADQDCSIGRGLCAIRMKENARSLFVYHYLRSIESKIEQYGSGSTFKAINKRQIEDIEIPLPDLKTQDQIITLLERAESLKERRTSVNFETPLFLLSLFNDLFYANGGKTEWEIKKIAEVSTIVSGGTPSRKKPEYFHGDIPWVTSVSLNKTYLRNTDGKDYITHDAVKESATHLIQRKSVLFGNRVCVGNVAINSDPIAFSQDVISINYDESLIVPEYLLFFLKTKKNYFKSKTRGSTIKGVTIQTVKELEIPLPPISLQNYFAATVSRMESLKERQKRSTQDIEQLFDVLIQRAFNGTLAESAILTG